MNYTNIANFLNKYSELYIEDFSDNVNDANSLLNFYKSNPLDLNSQIELLNLIYSLKHNFLSDILLNEHFNVDSQDLHHYIDSLKLKNGVSITSKQQDFQDNYEELKLIEHSFLGEFHFQPFLDFLLSVNNPHYYSLKENLPSIDLNIFNDSESLWITPSIKHSELIRLSRPEQFFYQNFSFNMGVTNLLLNLDDNLIRKIDFKDSFNTIYPELKVYSKFFYSPLTHLYSPKILEHILNNRNKNPFYKNFLKNLLSYSQQNQPEHENLIIIAGLSLFLNLKKDNDEHKETLLDFVEKFSFDKIYNQLVEIQDESNNNYTITINKESWIIVLLLEKLNLNDNYLDNEIPAKLKKLHLDNSLIKSISTFETWEDNVQNLILPNIFNHITQSFDSEKSNKEFIYHSIESNDEKIKVSLTLNNFSNNYLFKLSDIIRDNIINLNTILPFISAHSHVRFKHIHELFTNQTEPLLERLFLEESVSRVDIKSRKPIKKF